MKVHAWAVHEPERAMVFEERDEHPGDGEVIVKVAGCGVCHTDLGFFYEGVPTRHPLPLVLGHEISGSVVATGEGVGEWMGRSVVVPAVIPCGRCPACVADRGSICPHQIFPGNDVHGGFGSHVRVPAVGLCPVPNLEDRDRNPRGLSLSTLSVIADAVSTPYQAVRRADLRRGDLAVFVGAGGVGGFGIQIAHHLGAHVVAIDTNPDRLKTMREFGADLTFDPREVDFKAMKKAIRAAAKEREIPSWRWKVFETSGSPAGQRTAFGLLGHGSYLSVVGFTPQRVELRLSNLMAFDAVAEGNWGCAPALYPDIVELVLNGAIELEAFVEHRPLSTINETFEEVRAHRCTRRVILEPGEVD